MKTLTGSNQSMNSFSRALRLSAFTGDRFWIFAALSVVLLVSFRTSWLNMADAWWNSETYSHGLMVAPICVWLLWRFRHTLSSSEKGSPFFGGGLLLLFSVAWMLGRSLDIKVMMNFSVVGILCAIGLVVFGFQAVWRAKFVFIFLFFLVPFGEFLEPMLMEQTAGVTVTLLRGSGIPVFREGMQFRLPTGSWSVIEACSGLRYIIAALILSSLFAHLRHMKIWVSVGFVFMALLVAILANWIRAYTVVLVGHFSDMRYGTGDDHVWYGWVFFGIVMFGVFAIGQRLGNDDKAASIEATANEGPAKKPLSIADISSIFVSFWLVIAIPFIAANLQEQTTIKGFFEENLQPSLGATLTNPVYEPNFTNPVDKAAFRSGEGRGSVDRHFFYYAAQSRRQSKMIGSGHGITKPAETSPWKVVYFGQSQASSGYVASEALIDGPGGRRLIWHWYQVGTHQVSSPYKALAYTVLNTATGRGDHAVATVMSTPVTDGVDVARKALVNHYASSLEFTNKGFAK
jgi:exosortase A